MVVYSDHLEPERHSLSIRPSISFFHIEEIQSYTAVHWASHAWVTFKQASDVPQSTVAAMAIGRPHWSSRKHGGECRNHSLGIKLTADCTNCHPKKDPHCNLKQCYWIGDRQKVKDDMHFITAFNHLTLWMFASHFLHDSINSIMIFSFWEYFHFFSVKAWYVSYSPIWWECTASVIHTA